MKLKRTRETSIAPHINAVTSTTGWPKKVSHYQQSLENRMKTVSEAIFFVDFERKMSKRIL